MKKISLTAGVLCFGLSVIVQADQQSTATKLSASDYIQQHLKSLRVTSHHDIDMSKLVLEHDWKMSLDDGTLSHHSVPSDKLVVKGNVLATYNPFDKTLKWAWANPNIPTHIKINQHDMECNPCPNKRIFGTPIVDLDKTQAESIMLNFMHCGGYADVLSGNVGTLVVYVMVSQPLPMVKSQHPRKIYYKIVP